ncbi:MAG: iron-sulfur cluster assembly accessory protein [Holosporaceae bacterium]|jgi:iron-sulfur cluster assembly protein|nr:iron-sulfur cluster assembly accessory protein [Holosporaceae bacterium]
MEKLIEITDNALDFMKKAIAEQNCLGIRVNVIPGGCRGMAYELNFVNEADQSDLLVEKDGVNLYVAADAVVFISGMTMDYVASPMGGSVIFSNPNATSCCGCGKSFNVEGAEACGGCCCG